MASHIPLLEDDRVIGLDGKPLALLPINDWSGLPFETHPHMRKGEVAHRFQTRSPLLLVHLGAHGPIARSVRAETVYDLLLAPGQVDVLLVRLPDGLWLVGLRPWRSATPVELDPGTGPLVRTRRTSAWSSRARCCRRVIPFSSASAAASAPRSTPVAESGKLCAEGISLALLSRTAHFAMPPPAEPPRAPRALSRQQLAAPRWNLPGRRQHRRRSSVSRDSRAQIGISPYSFSRGCARPRPTTRRPRLRSLVPDPAS